MRGGHRQESCHAGCCRAGRVRHRQQKWNHCYFRKQIWRNSEKRGLSGSPESQPQKQNIKTGQQREWTRRLPFWCSRMLGDSSRSFSLKHLGCMERRKLGREGDKPYRMLSEQIKHIWHAKDCVLTCSKPSHHRMPDLSSCGSASSWYPSRIKPAPNRGRKCWRKS